MKKLLIFLIIFFTLISLVSCHGKKETVEERKVYKGSEFSDFKFPESFDESKEYTITFYSKNDSNIKQKNIYNQAIEDFEKFYPNIKVQMNDYYDYKDIYNDVLVNIPTDTTPNVSITYPDHVASYKDGNNIVVPLENLVNDANYGLNGSKVKFTTATGIIDKFYNECQFDGHLYCIPFMRSSEACYVNVDLIKELGFELPEILTWEYVWTVCKKAREIYTDRSFLPLIYKSTDNMIIQMCKQYDIPYSDEEGHILLFNNKMTDLLLELGVYASPGVINNRLFETFKRVSYPGNYFNKGKCIFAIDSTAGATWMGTHAPLSDIHSSEVKEFETKVMPIPQYKADEISMISQGPSLCIFNKNDNQEVLASWLFAQFLLTKEVQTKYSQTEGYIPVTKDTLEDSEYQNYLNHEDDGTDLYYGVKREASKLVIANINNTFITPVFNGSSLLRLAAGDLAEAMFDKKYSGSSENIVKLYSEERAQYHFETITKPKISSGAIVLIVVLLVTWSGIMGLNFYVYHKKKKLKLNSKK